MWCSMTLHQFTSWFATIRSTSDHKVSLNLNKKIVVQLSTTNHNIINGSTDYKSQCPNTAIQRVSTLAIGYKE